MRRLNEVIGALRGEIMSALDEGGALPEGARLEAERVVVSLAFDIHEASAGHGGEALRFEVPTSTGKAKPAPAQHTVTIEFKVARPGVATRDASAKPGEAKPVRRELFSDADAEGVVKTLSEVFGAPGFDSSARATVFREALEGLSEEQARSVIASLDGGNLPDEADLKRSRNLVSRLIGSGPAGAKRGGKLLAGLFQRFPVQPIVELVAARWKTQTDWIV